MPLPLPPPGGPGAVSLRQNANPKTGAGMGLHIPNPLDIFHGLNLGAWLLRIGEIVLGVVLMGVGVAKLTNAIPIATKIATAVK